jgi:coenzyme PQQ precursor peptide PqqA
MQQSIGRIAMEWETPEFVEISLACEISGYANAELSVAVSAAPRDVTPSTKT